MKYTGPYKVEIVVHRVWRLAVVIVAMACSSVAHSTVITGAELLEMDGSGVTFPNIRPKVDGNSIIFEGNDSLQTLFEYELASATEFSLSVDLTRLDCVGTSCVGGTTDSDPHLLIGDGTWMFGIVFSDNLDGQLLAADLYIPQGARNLTSLVSGIGYPAIGSSAQIDLKFSLSSTSTLVEAYVFGTTTSFSWQRALSLDSLTFNMLQDNDSGERYQLNSLTVPMAQIPEPRTLALFAIGLAGMALARCWRLARCEDR